MPVRSALTPFLLWLISGVLGGVFSGVFGGPLVTLVWGSELQVYPDHVQVAADAAPVQLVVSERTADGRQIDRTAEAVFTATDPRVLQVDASGTLTPMTDGHASIVISVGDQQSQVEIQTVHCAQRPVPDFATEVQAILASGGCSTGACHGKQGGQNGFQLSLLGFDADSDYAAITKEARGRRIFPASPTSSLLLRKASAGVPHGGGKRMSVDDPRYKTLLAWIQAGAPRASEQPVSVESIRIDPPELVLAPSAVHRVVVTATYSDGTQRDVTSLTAFSSNESVIANVRDAATVEAGPIAGEATIMARFLDHIATCNVLIPRPEPVPTEVYQQLASNNVVDQLVWRKLQRLNIVPSPRTSDATFLRRVHLDIIGRPPSPEAVRDFLADGSPQKYERVVDELLEHPGYADHWANKWVDLLRPNAYRVGIKAVLSLDDWVRQAFRENWPYDKFVRELLTAQGSTWHNGATTLFRDRRSADELTTIVSQLFLGVRLECAKCHHHPFEVWGQDDFYSFAAYFSRLGRKGTGLSPPISGGEEMLFVADKGQVTHPRTGEVMQPRALGATTAKLSDGGDPRAALLDWMTADDNPYFAKVIANRIWAELMGRGIVDPVDDMRATNPASNEELLQALADHLKANDYNLKALIRLIATSEVYARDSLPNPTNAGDHRNFSRHYRQRLRAEVLLDAINDITRSSQSFAAMPAGSRANEIWTHRIPSLFLDTFSRPDMNQDPPCERVSDTAVVQALHLMNSPELHQKITADDGYAAELAKSERASSDIVESLYLRVYCRFPTDEERSMGEAWIDKAESRRAAVEDLLWAMVNSAEFVFKD